MPKMNRAELERMLKNMKELAGSQSKPITNEEGLWLALTTPDREDVLKTITVLEKKLSELEGVGDDIS